MSLRVQYEFNRLLAHRAAGHRPGQELCILVHPSRETEAEDFAAEIGKQLGETVGVVTENDCPQGKVYVVNRDYYDQLAKHPWEVGA